MASAQKASGSGDIELAGLCKSYDGVTNAVDGVNLKIPDGAYCCFLGPSGCGKTTILRMIAGHEDPTAGEILIGGGNVVGMAPVERRTAMMFQSYALFPHLNVRDNIAFALRVRGQSKAERLRAADEMMEKVRLTEFADRLPAHLSGGQQQRVALARAAITGPRVLLLDEPLSALDEQLRVQMRQELRRMQRELGITFVHVTHTQLEAIALADVVVVMERGRIKQAGAARDVYASPRDRYVAEFLGGQNVLSGKVEKVDGSRLLFAQPDRKSIEIPLPGGSDVGVGDRIDVAVRRDDIELRRPEAASPPAQGPGLPGRVLAIEYQGSFVKVMLDTVPEADFVAYVPERTYFRDPFSIGDVVVASWAFDRARLLA
ncbi:ABC transporter ATP-binding protein [Labrys monachus]|uniref:Spermidine/putrescine transport system ATP-binding protein n=1 Tax=Labrys monachus TaxID=217067 RepID=A0ABU0F923_9HYPH|nr:ABC transporter ATP-binding protein [Labrys monachus]MDQ0391108.1 putative spermidine/putrescine transport system ATP-binding protein [Labrys monachus]